MHLARDAKSTYLLGMFLCRLKDHCASVFHFRKTQDKRETSPRTNLRNLCLESCKFLCKPSILGVCLVNKDPKVKCRELSKVAFQNGEGTLDAQWGSRPPNQTEKQKKKRGKRLRFGKGSRVYLNKTTLETHLFYNKRVIWKKFVR